MKYCECVHTSHFTRPSGTGAEHAFEAPCTYVIRVDDLLICGDCDKAGHGQQGRPVLQSA